MPVNLPQFLILLAVLSAAVVAFFVALRHSLQAPVSAGPFDPEALLAPLREQIRALQKDLNDNRADSARTQGALFEQLDGMSRQTQELLRQGTELGKTTTRISTALQGTGVSGDWGEMQLRRTVELAGLTENVSFFEQETVQTPEGRLRPDMVVNLPDARRIVVDAKAPLIDFASSEDAAKRQADALEVHIRDLSRRNYSQFVEGSIDFVVLFVPTEGILATALSERPKISEDAVRMRVLLATPMTLLAMLRAVEFGWRQIQQAENAAHIAKRAGELWDALATFVDHFNRIGSGLKTAVNAFNAAAGSLDGNVRPKARDMRELGITVTSEIAPLSEPAEPHRIVNWKL